MISEAHNQTQITRIPFDDQKPYFTVSKPLLTAMLHTILERENLRLERERSVHLERGKILNSLCFLLYSVFIYLLSITQTIITMCFMNMSE